MEKVKKTPEREKVLEARLRKEVKEKGGIAIKLSAQFSPGLPDRLVLMPGGRVHFVEMKGTTGKLSMSQTLFIQKLQRMGFDAQVVASTDDLENFLFKLDIETICCALKSLNKALKTDTDAGKDNI